jgi:hypothetical protein
MLEEKIMILKILLILEEVMEEMENVENSRIIQTIEYLIIMLKIIRMQVDLMILLEDSYE